MSQPSGSSKRSISQTEPPLNEPPAKRTLETTLESVPNDFDDETHREMDAKVFDLAADDPHLLFAHTSLLCAIVATSKGRLDPKYGQVLDGADLFKKHPELSDKLNMARTAGTFKEIRNLRILRPSNESDPGPRYWEIDKRLSNTLRLSKAYHTRYLGDAAINFIKYLEIKDAEKSAKPIYAKAVSVVQASGSGKSRKLTEVGRYILTLAICLRSPRDPGYPPSDTAVFEYFNSIPGANDLSLTAHHSIASFLAAAHTIMLAWLKRLHDEQATEVEGLLKTWHDLMEGKERGEREKFFDEVVALAKKFNTQSRSSLKPSPKRKADDGHPDEPDYDPSVAARQCFTVHAMAATENLMQFVSGLSPGGNPLCVTYFDEAHELGLRYWIMLRLLQVQKSSTRMWYVFMGTKSSVSYYAPAPDKRLSLKLRQEMMQLVSPYVALDFDQQIIANGGTLVDIPFKRLETIEHAAQYGRPLWHAQLPESTPGEMVGLASMKLTNAYDFIEIDKNHVFAVLSQRLCLDPVLTGSEAIELADRSVSHHMRLLIGFSDNDQIFYTHSPSEPILVLGAIDILYDPVHPKRLAKVLNTFSNDLCSSGLVDKGNLGELAARILLLIARDYAAPKLSYAESFLKPVRFLDVIRNLFGTATWAGLNQASFDNAFVNAHVNFTHWMVTKDALPEEPDQQLLANLWTRHAILQCNHNQASLDCLCPVYFGDVSGDAIFNPALLSGAVVQVKYKDEADTKAGTALRPIGIPRDLSRPLPYLALLMELGNESMHMATGTKIKSTASKPPSTHEYLNLTNNWVAAVKVLQEYQTRPTQTRTESKKLKDAVYATRLAMDCCNRFSISARGATADVYGILNKADIAGEFATFLKVTMPSPTYQDSAIQRMQPLEHLGDKSPHTAWMSKISVSQR